MTDSIRINRIDALEPRFLLTSFATLNAAGVLSIVGTPQSNVIDVAYSSSNVKVTRDGSSLCFAKTKVKKIWAEAYGGNDKITIGVPLPSTLIGDAGNDTLVGNIKNDELHGGSGDDHLTGGDSEDPGWPEVGNSYDLGGGNDVLDYSAQKPGLFELEAYYYGPPSLDHTVNGNVVSTDRLVVNDLERRVTVLLTPGNDSFAAFTSSDWTVDGGSGNDDFVVVGTPYVSINRLNGGAGNDGFTWYDGEGGAPGYVDGGPGNDVFNHFQGTRSTIACDGGSGYDTYNIEFPSSSFPSGDVTVPPGIEAFNADAMLELVVHGNDLNNTISASALNVTLYGNGGNDRLNVNADPNGADAYNPGQGLADGGSGNDTLAGGAGHDTLVGGSGNDTADYSGRSDNLTITLDNQGNDGAAGEHDNVMSDVENVIGGSGNDKITGSPSNNVLRGGKGNDSLYGGSGADALFGNDGNDLLDGGSGDDYLQGWTGNDALFGRDGNDKLDAGDGDDYLEGNAGNDTLTGGSGHDKLYGQDGNDTLMAKDGQKDSLDGGNGFDKAQRDNTSTIKDSVLNIESFI